MKKGNPIRAIPILTIIVLALAMSQLIYGCGIKAMTPAQKEYQIKVLANDIGLYIFTKHKDLIEKGKVQADKIIAAASSTEIGSLYTMAFQYYLNTHPENVIFISMGRQLIGLMGVEFSGIDVIPDSIDIGLAKIAAISFKNGLEGKIES